MEEGSLFEPKEGGDDVAREAAKLGVIFLDSFVVAHPFYRETILRAGELVHQAGKCGVGLQVGVVFNNNQQAG